MTSQAWFLIFSVVVCQALAGTTERPCTVENEEFTSCGSSCPPTCQNVKGPAFPCTANCVPGCFCKAGYLRDEKTNQCFLPEKCPAGPSNECGENEEFTSCGTACPTTCQNKDGPAFLCTANCVVGCFCKSGYIRDEATKKCVSVENCPPKCNDPNEEYTHCGAPCPTTCKNRNKRLKPCTARCTDGCFCREGYLRDEKNNKCVRPTTNFCRDPNEQFLSCGTACPLTCDNKDNPPRFCTFNCVAACFCKEGYIRNEQNQKCVLPENCPSGCKGDPNAVSAPCGNPCPRTCSNLFQRRPRPCPAICIIGGCVCKDGFVLNEATGKCVKPEDCRGALLSCKEHEVYIPCNSPCPPESCRVVDIAFRCAAPDPATCKPACRCELGYFRNKQGLCITAEKCRGGKLFSCMEHEFYTSCNGVCPPESCNAVGIAFNCVGPDPATCRPACRCMPGYYRNKEGLCITAEKCRETEPQDIPTFKSHRKF